MSRGDVSRAPPRGRVNRTAKRQKGADGRRATGTGTHTTWRSAPTGRPGNQGDGLRQAPQTQLHPTQKPPPPKAPAPPTPPPPNRSTGARCATNRTPTPAHRSHTSRRAGRHALLSRGGGRGGGRRGHRARPRWRRGRCHEPQYPYARTRGNDGIAPRGKRPVIPGRWPAKSARGSRAEATVAARSRRGAAVPVPADQRERRQNPERERRHSTEREAPRHPGVLARQKRAREPRGSIGSSPQPAGWQR